MTRPRVKHPTYGWGTVIEVHDVYTDADGPRLQAGDIGALVRFDNQHESERPSPVVIDATMPIENAAAFTEMVRSVS